TSKVSKSVVRTNILNDKEKIGHLVGVRPSSSSVDAANFVKDIDNVKNYLEALNFSFSAHTDRYNYIRINIVEGMFTSATLLLPPFIVGDGKLTIKELVNNYNETRLQSAYFNRYLFTIDEEFENKLTEDGLQLDSILSNDAIYILKERHSKIGESETIDITKDISQKITEYIQETVAAIPELYTAAVDIVTSDYKNSSEIDLVSISASPNPLVSYITRKGHGVNIYESYIASLIVSHKIRINKDLSNDEEI